MPSRIVLVGGGYIAAEFSHIAARAGANVTVLQRAERILPRFDSDLVGWLMEAFNALAIDVRTKTVVEAIDKTNSGFVVHARSDRKSRHSKLILLSMLRAVRLLLKNSTLLRPTYKLKRVGSS